MEPSRTQSNTNSDHCPADALRELVAPKWDRATHMPSRRFSFTKVVAHSPKKFIGIEHDTAGLGAPRKADTHIKAFLVRCAKSKLVLGLNPFEIVNPSAERAKLLTHEIAEAVLSHFVDEMDQYFSASSLTIENRRPLSLRIRDSWRSMDYTGLRDESIDSLSSRIEERSPYVTYLLRPGIGSHCSDLLPASFHHVAADASPVLVTRVETFHSKLAGRLEFFFPEGYLAQKPGHLKRLLTVIEGAMLETGIHPVKERD